MNDQDKAREELIAELVELRQRLANLDGPAAPGQQATPASALADVSEHRQRLADILEASRAGTWEWNVQTGEAIFNQRWAEILGYSLDELAPTSIQTWEGLVQPDDLQASQAMLARHFRGELSHYDFDVRMRHADGRWVWVRMRGRVTTWTRDGQPLWMRGICHDVTGLKRAEAAYEASERRLHAYVNQIADALVVHDAAGRFLDVNPQTCANLGYSREELLCLNIADVETELNWSDAVCRRFAPGETITMQGRHRRKDGFTFPVEVRVTCFDLEGQRYYLALARDLTERMQAEQTLRDAQARLSLAVESSGIGFWDWDLRTNAVHFSSEWKRQIGYRDEEIADRFEEWHSRVHPDDLDYVLHRIQSYLSDPQGRHEVEFRFRHKDGSYRTVFTQAAATIGDDGKPARFLGCHIDITERKRAEELLRKSEERMDLAFHAAQDGVWDWNLETDEVFYSSRWKAMLGYDEAEIEPHASAWKRLLHPDDLPRVLQVVDDVMCGKRDYVIEFRMRHKDGHYVDVLSRGFPVRRQPDGPIVRIVGTHFDLTERKRTEEALRQSEQRERERATELQTILDTVPVGLAIAQDLQGHHIRGNRANEEMFGLPPGAELSKGGTRPARYRVFQADRELLLAELPMQRAIRGEVVRGQVIEVLREDGQTMTVYAKATPLLDEAGHPRGAVGAFLDITELKRVEELLRKSERRLAVAASGARIGMFEWDLATDECLWSEQHARLLGYTTTTTTTTTTLSLSYKYTDWADRVHPEDLPRVQNELRRCIAEHTPYEVEYRILWPDGSEHWILGRGVCEYTSEGPPQRMLGVAMDITESKRAEAALIASEARLRLALDAARMVAWEYSPATLKVTLSENAETVLGLPRRHETSDQGYRLIHPDDVEHHRTLVTQAIAQHSSYVSEYRFALQGRTIWLEEHGRAVLDPSGTTCRLVGVVQNITQRKLAELELERVRNQLADAQRIAHLGSWEYVAATRETVWSDEEKRIYGLDPAQPSPEYDAMLRQCIHPDDAAELDRCFRTAFQNCETFENEHRIVRPDGSVRFIYDKAQPYFDSAGQLVRYVGATLDITERKQAEEALKASLREKEALLREIHHRVKNNLQVVSSMVSLQAGEAVDEAIREVLQDVTNRVRSMALVHEKLYQSADLGQVDFAEYAESLLHYLWRAYRTTASGARLSLDLEPVAIPVHAAVPCGLILNELAGNALKHAFPGGREGEVSVSLRADSAGRICLRVRDNGVGLPAGLDWRSGKSLGLHLVQIFAEQLAADVAVASHPGTEFTVAFGGTKA